jgi:hypothetical protein
MHMKNSLWIILFAIPFVLMACNEVEDEENKEIVTKDLPMRWTPWPCTINDEMGIPIAPGAKCKYHQSGGCKWPTKCIKKTYSFVQLAVANTPGLSADNWGNETIPLTDYDILLELWREDPYNFYHPDSIPPDTIH